MLSALNDDLPDDLLSGWESSNSNGGGLTNGGSVDQLPGGGGGPPNGPQPMMNSGMGRNMNPMGGMVPNQNMNLVNALNKNKSNGPGGMVGPMTSVPHSMSDNMSPINTSLQSSSMSQVSIGHPGQMSMAPMNSMNSGDMTMVSSGMPNMQMQQMRPIMGGGPQTIISSQPGMNGPMVRHVNQMGPMGGMQRQGGPNMIPGQPRMISGPGVRMQNMVSNIFFNLVLYLLLSLA